MKTLFTLVLVLYFVDGIHLFAQNKLFTILPLKENKVVYSNVINLENTTKEELYHRARKWMAYTSEVIKVDDKNELIGNGNILNDVWYTISIKLKDGKYKYEITDLKIKYFYVSSGSSYWGNYPIELKRNKRKIRRGGASLNEIHQEINKLITSLKETMQTPINDNW